MVKQSQVREGLCEITLHYRSFVSNHAPHVCEIPVAMRQTRRTRGKCCHPPVTSANIRACFQQEAAARPRPATSGCHGLLAEPRHVATRAGAFYHPAVMVACEDCALACRATAGGKHDAKRRDRFQPAL